MKIRKMKRVIATIMAIIMVVGICPVTNIIADSFSSNKLCIQFVKNGIPISNGDSITCTFKNVSQAAPSTVNIGENGIGETVYQVGEVYDEGNEFVLTVGEDEYPMTIDLKTTKQFLIFDVINKTYSWSDNAIVIDKLLSVENISDIDGIENGVEKTKEALKLPSKVGINTTQGIVTEAEIVWDVEGCSYDKNEVNEQTFIVSGTIILPDSIKNIDNVSLNVQVRVTVNKMQDATFVTQPESVDLYVDETLSLSVATKNADENTYQWYKDGEKLYGETGTTLIINNVKLTDKGDYSCKVTGINGNIVSSNTAKVRVNKITPNLAISTSVSSPATKPVDSITISAVGVNDDAAGTFTFYVNNVEKQSGNSREYVFYVPDEDVSSYSFKVTYSGNDTKYNQAEKTSTFYLNKGNQNTPTINLNKTVMKDIDDSVPVVSVSGGESKGKYVYAIGEEYDIAGNKLEKNVGATLVADISQSGIITVKRSGKFQITVYKEGDNNYNNSEIVTSELVEVGKKAQTGFHFAQTSVQEDYFTGEIITNSAEGGESSGDIVYDIVSGDSVVDLNNRNSSKVTVKKSGEAVIKATHLGDDVYADANATYTIKINKGYQSLEFNDKNPTNRYYGINDFSNSVVSKDRNQKVIMDAEGEITYTIQSGENIASINSETGKLTFKNGQLGSVVVKATREECDRYVKAEAIYTLNIIDSSMPSEAYSIDGRKSNDDSDWYISNITIKAPDGFLIGTSNDIDGDYRESLLITEEGDTNGLTIYLKNINTGNITANGIYIDDKLLKLDKSEPIDINVEYIEGSWIDKIWSNLSYGFYKEQVKVKISAKDLESGISELWWRYDKQDNSNPVDNDDYVSSINKDSDESEIYRRCSEVTYDGKSAYATITVPVDIGEQIRGNITVKAVNNAGLFSVNKDERIIITDTISPTRKIEFSEAKQILYADTMDTCNNYDYSTEGSDYKLYYDSKAVAKISINEANFVEEDLKIIIKDIVNNTEKPVELQKNTWVREGDTWVNQLEISDEGHYTINMKYKDRSQNEMVEYISNEIIIDKSAPIISVEYFDVDEKVNVESSSYAQRKAKITVVENNFRASDISGEVSAKNLSGYNVDVMDDIISYMQKTENWTTQGDLHTIVVTFDRGAVYNFKLSYTDLSLQKSNGINDNFVVDITPPEIVSVTYSTALTEHLLNNIFFGYYNPFVDITIVVSDDTTKISQIEWEYNREKGVSTNNEEKLSGKITEFERYVDYDRKTKFMAKIRLPLSEKQLRGNIIFTIYDEANNKFIGNEKRVFVVDTISPTREVSFSNADRIVNSASMKDVMKYNYTTEGEKYKLYYNKPAIAKMTVDEANFYAEDVKVSIIDIVNDTIKQLSPNQCDWKKSSENDKWNANIKFEEEGHYKLKITYQDRSHNSMKEYISNEIIIDYTNPKIKLNYSPGNDIRTVKSRKYYNKKQTAEISITENNFRAADVDVVVTAKDISGNKIKTSDYSSYLKQETSWKTKGDVHTAKITYSKDANYTFDISYEDLAQHKNNKYKQDKFTVDKKAPSDLEVHYSKSMLASIIENISFGFYKAPVTVTIQAKDRVAGVDHFVYSYENNKNVDKNNAELIDKLISNARIKYSENQKEATATFTIPKGVLTANKQFRGKISFDVSDRSDNQRSKKERKNIVVDNIAPKGMVTLSKPVSSNNGEDYYTGSITAKIKIKESNFFKGDVVVRVNGTSRKINNWKKDGNNWEGIVNISGDGHYILTVDYRDKSQNKMKHYKSKRLTIDTIKPSIIVNGVKNESANKNKKVGFSIVAQDENLNSGLFNVNLKAIYRTKTGEYRTRNIKIDKQKLSNGGKTQSYIVDNLTDDAIYTLDCNVADRAGNRVDSFDIKDSNNRGMKTMSFSVNRKGSTFILDDYIQDVVDKYFVQNVNKDVKITEINVDTLREYKVELNKKKLKEGVDYNVEKTGGNGKWSKYIYSIKSSLFNTEGNYSLVVSTKDKAKTKSYSDMKNAEVAFTIDRTNPKIVVSGLEKNGRYQTDSQKVTIVPTDDGGRLSSIKVLVKDSDGKITSTPFELEGEKLEKTMESSDNKLVFNLKEGMYQDVDIVCTDQAGNEYTSNEEFYNVTVSPSAFVMFWANSILRWIVICSIILISGVVIFIVIKKKNQ